ncbi:unnamed protein product [Taenia asiatica]|uniref:DUF5753 domain-containing protein n=1 Tax=Taenia asiatica TaxID=60517 RepID=A0A0R3VSJ9_TAEAS|nr:unnamed protein product [Taenia asiatica]
MRCTTREAGRGAREGAEGYRDAYAFPYAIRTAQVDALALARTRCETVVPFFLAPSLSLRHPARLLSRCLPLPCPVSRATSTAVSVGAANASVYA